MNQCSTVRYYKRTRCEWGGGRDEERCIVACVICREQRGTPRNDSLSRVFRPSIQVRLLPFDTLNVTYAYNFIIHITPRHDLKSATCLRDRENLSPKFGATQRTWENLRLDNNWNNYGNYYEINYGIKLLLLLIKL